MTPTVPGPATPTPDEANEQIRRLCAGRTQWTAAERAELNRLRAAYLRGARGDKLIGAPGS